jgi:hypothetical protein
MLVFSVLVASILFSCNNKMNTDNGEDHYNNEKMERDKTDYKPDTSNFDEREKDSLQLRTDSV